ncbi:MAG TPA: tRNA lysidine(34) synthetase TilS [Gemmatimonadota bacterium]|nr:tRNA lysidine(34) synthetase TilS [Gemmatimonadota bacterium]
MPVPEHVRTPATPARPGGATADLPDRLESHLRERRDLLPPGSRILVALSGGPDSTALLLLLNGLAPAFDWSLTAAHFDHGIRPGGAERIARLRSRLAPLGVPLVAGAPERQLDRAHAELRRARYDWLRREADAVAADRIATAHQRDDQVETVLFRILRGTGNRGLAGIPARRGRLVRPLLGFGRDELARWVDEQGAEPFDDPSNRDRRYARSRLRHDLLPALERAVGVDVGESLLAIAGAAAEVCRNTERVAARALDAMAEGSAPDWPVELRAEALRLAGRRAGVRLRGAAVRRAARELPELVSGHGFDLGGGLRLERTFDAWRVRRTGTEAGDFEPLIIDDAGVGSGGFGASGHRRRVRWGPAQPAGSGGTRVALRVQADHFPLVIRPWSAGDRIRLPGGGRKLSRLMSEARIPRSERRSAPVLVDRHGRILCVLRRELSHRIDRDAAANVNFGFEVEDG